MIGRPGCYHHYKDNEYPAIGVARHSETNKELVVCRQEYGIAALGCVRWGYLLNQLVGGRIVRRSECVEEDR